MKTFVDKKKQFSLFCVVFMMMGLLGIPMSIHAEDTVMTYPLYHKHIAGCTGTVYETKTAEVENGPFIVEESTCSLCGGYVHDYEYSASCSCGLSWYDDGWACVNSYYGTNQKGCPNFNVVDVDTTHEHPVTKRVCGMDESTIIEMIRIKCSTLAPAQQVTLTAQTDNKLQWVKLVWEGSNQQAAMTVSENGTYRLYATYAEQGIEYATKLDVTIGNIDRTAPTVSDIKADKTTPTNGKVVLSVEASDNVGLPTNYVSWNDGAYGSSNKLEVTANGTYKVSVKDQAGNVVTKSIKVSNIDKTAPTVSDIKADKTTPTNDKVVLSVEASDNVGLPTNYASWNDEAYGSSNKLEVTSNGTYKVSVKDQAGNVVTKSIKVSNIDKTAPVVSDIKADKTTPTNGKVVLSVEASDNVGLPTNYASWNDGAYGSSNKLEVTSNGTYMVSVKDQAGNVVTKSIKVSNIDKIAPVVSDIKADKTTPTNGKVVLSVEASDNVGLPTNYVSWNDGAYGSSNKLEVTENGTYKVSIKDQAGNVATKSIKVSNIDKIAPIVSDIKADKTTPTNGNVVLSMEASDNVDFPANYISWNDGAYGNSNKFEVTSNGTYKVSVIDRAGNVTTKSIKVSNIDRTIPIVNIKTDKITPTNGKVVLSIEATDNVGLPTNYASWNDGAYGSSNKFEVTSNGTYKVSVKDQAGNVVTKSIKVSNIDKTAPTVSDIKADKTAPTNGKVVLSIEATDNVGLPTNYASWNDGAYGSSNKMEVTVNGTYKVSVKDQAGNVVTKSIKVSNIDKTAPVVNIKADKTALTNGKVVLSIEATDNMGLPTNYASWNGGTYGSSNKLEVTVNGTYKVSVKDQAGNIVTKSITVSNIDKTAPTVSEIKADTDIVTNKTIILSIDVEDNEKLPGEYISWNDEEYGNDKEYEVSENGIYKVTVKDDAGNSVTKTIEINNIDKAAPVIVSVVTNPNPWYEGDCEITVKAKDIGDNQEDRNLAKEAYSWDKGKTWTKDNVYKTSESGLITVMVRDEAGNIAQLDVKVVREERAESSESNESSKPENNEKHPQGDNNNQKHENAKEDIATSESDKIKENGEVDDFFVQEVEKEENVVEVKPFWGEEEPLELDLIENDKEDKNGVLWFAVIGVTALGTVLLLFLLYVLLAMCRIYEVDAKGRERYLGRTGLRYSRKIYTIHIGKEMIDRASERIIKIKLPAWFVKMKENQLLRIVVASVIIEKYIEKEIKFHMQA